MSCATTRDSGHMTRNREPARGQAVGLFEDGKETLFLYSFMFIAGPDGDPIGSPCPTARRSSMRSPDRRNT